MSEKDFSLLDPSASPTRTDSLHEKIERIERELARGREVYTDDELDKLKRMRDDYLLLLQNLIGA